MPEQQEGGVPFLGSTPFWNDVEVVSTITMVSTAFSFALPFLRVDRKFNYTIYRNRSLTLFILYNFHLFCVLNMKFLCDIITQDVKISLMTWSSSDAQR